MCGLIPDCNTSQIVGLIYQSNVETSTDLCAQINLRQSSHVIHETFVCRQSHHTNDRTLINVAAENNHHFNITPLKTSRFRSLALVFMTRRNETRPKRGSNLIKKKIDLTPKTPVNLVIANS